MKFKNSIFKIFLFYNLVNCENTENLFVITVGKEKKAKLDLVAVNIGVSAVLMNGLKTFNAY